MPEKVGFIGLGIMGRPMAKNLIEAGYDLVLHNRTQSKAEELAEEAGGVAVGTSREVAEQTDIVITCLPDSPDVEAVVEGEDGVLGGIRPGALLVDMSTISPVVSRRLAERIEEAGASMLDAPISGGDTGAIEGTLSIMVGGEEDDFERARPLFEVMGSTVVLVGDKGAGQVTKAANQVLVGLTIAAISEALVLGSKGGVKPEKILDVLGGGFASNRVMEVRRDNFLNHDFTPGFRSELHHKDLGIATEAAREYGVSLPLTAIVDQLFLTMKKKGWGEHDHSGLLQVFEELSNYRIGD